MISRGHFPNTIFGSKKRNCNFYLKKNEQQNNLVFIFWFAF
jgi:hypothetical protein